MSALDHLSSAFEDSLEDWPKVDGAARRSAHLAEAYGFELIDTKSFCAQILASSLPATVRDAAGAVEDLTAPGGFILSERHRGDTVQSCGGLSVYYPTGRRGISPYYGDLALSREHGWDGFLRRAGRGALEYRVTRARAASTAGMRRQLVASSPRASDSASCSRATSPIFRAMTSDTGIVRSAPTAPALSIAEIGIRIIPNPGSVSASDLSASGRMSSMPSNTYP